MKSDIEIKELIKQLVVDSPLGQSVAGGIYTEERPAGATTEDIVISVVDGKNGQVQTAKLKVEVYVRDIETEGVPSENSARIRELSSLSIESLDNLAMNDYKIEIERQSYAPVEGGNERCIINNIVLIILNY